MAQVVFLAGGIASGKSTVAKRLRQLGACCVDLDTISREVTSAGSAVVQQLAQAFGDAVVDQKTGELRRSELARMAFASEEGTRTLEGITHPAIRGALVAWLRAHESCGVCVVEVPLLDRVEDLIPMADEVLCVVCALPKRRQRAVQRGMDACDFDARVAKQPTDEYLSSKATTVINNNGDASALEALVDEWWKFHAEPESPHAEDEM